MRLKQRIGDFRVRELLADGIVGGAGRHRVYRVTKRKLTSFEAASILAAELAVTPGDVALAGLKDRQGITTQYMSVEGGQPISLSSPELKIEAIGLAEREIDSDASDGNAFEVVVRDLGAGELARLRHNVPLVREQGLVNYFDDQRFGNLRHRQGWIVRQLLDGDVEGALRTLLCAVSPHDDPESRRFKTRLAESWGDWAACGDLAGRYGRHHSLFRHLKRAPGDFAEAFRFVATRVRLIHLYAFQSHLWNRAVAEAVRRVTEPGERILAATSEGPLVQPLETRKVVDAFGAAFRLPGPRLEDVASPEQRELFEHVLAAESLAPADLAIDGVPGFQLIGEDRPLIVVPRHLRVRPPVGDPLNRGARMVEVRFELPRGAYATLVVQRLLGEPDRAADESAPTREPAADADAPRRTYGRHYDGGRHGRPHRGGRNEGRRHGSGARRGGRPDVRVDGDDRWDDRSRRAGGDRRDERGRRGGHGRRPHEDQRSHAGHHAGHDGGRGGGRGGRRDERGPRHGGGGRRPGQRDGERGRQRSFDADGDRGFDAREGDRRERRDGERSYGGHGKGRGGYGRGDGGGRRGDRRDDHGRGGRDDRGRHRGYGRRPYEDRAEGRGRREHDGERGRRHEHRGSGGRRTGRRDERGRRRHDRGHGEGGARDARGGSFDERSRGAGGPGRRDHGRRGAHERRRGGRDRHDGGRADSQRGERSYAERGRRDDGRRENRPTDAPHGSTGPRGDASSSPPSGLGRRRYRPAWQSGPRRARLGGERPWKRRPKGSGPKA